MSETQQIGRGLLMALLAFSALPGDPAQAQNGDVAFQAVVGQPRGLPQLPPQGAWGEVINVTPRWLWCKTMPASSFRLP